MDDALLTEVLARLDRVPLATDAEQVLFGALDDGEALARALGDANGGGGGPRPEAPPAEPTGAVPAGAYLTSVKVAGFRGIGPAATLTLQPGPGLTVVCGRNGSGKSSFAEALEVLLTGTIKRWAERSAVWKDTWRCIHAPATEIDAELVVEGAGLTRLRRAWEAASTRLDDAETTVQQLGGPRAPMSSLGWDRALEAHRPFLSHAELEALLAEPKALYSQLNSLLGLEDLDAALGRVGAARREADKLSKAAGKDLPALRQAVAGVTDERAAAAALLQGRSPDVDALRLLATGAAVVDDGPLQLLGRLAALTAPDAAHVAAAAAELRRAAEAVEAARTTAVEGAASVADLLAAALAHTAGTHGTDCPVCGTPGVIDDDWRARTEAEVQRLRTANRSMTEATGHLDTAVRDARQLLQPAPGWLAQATAVGVDTAELARAWARWSDAPTTGDPAGAVALAGHLERVQPELTAALDRATEAARAERERRQDRWAPLAQEILGWCGRADDAARAKAGLVRLAATEAWLKEAAAEQRTERLRPFAERTVELWRELRQASNVELVEVRLAGAGNRSHVDFAVRVDGNDAAGLGVMSQGEVNALALSVFLPRATMSGSPFRFLVIDDPVQAMDPSKVDGLARVLVDVAADRQVIVFTHDDRLPDSLRRLDLPARVVGVTRHPGSVVELRPSGDPCEMILRDVHAVTRDERVPKAVSSQVVPTLCRTAIEQAAIDVVRRRRLARGQSHEEVEAVIASADKTMTRLALALLDDPDAGGQVYAALNRVSDRAADTVRTLQRGAHESGTSLDMDGLRKDTRRLLDAIRDLR